MPTPPRPPRRGLLGLLPASLFQGRNGHAICEKQRASYRHAEDVPYPRAQRRANKGTGSYSRW